MCPRMSCSAFPVHLRLIWAPRVRSATLAGRKAENLGVWLCRVRVLSGVWRCSLGVLCGLAVGLAELKAECVIYFRRLLVLGAILVRSSCASPGRDFPVGRGTTRNLGSVSTPRRGGSYRPGRGCDSRRRPQPVSAREVRVLGSGPDLRRGLWALGVGPRLRASVLGSDLEI